MVNNDIYNDHSSTFILTLFAYFYFCIWIYKPLLPFGELYCIVFVLFKCHAFMDFNCP